VKPSEARRRATPCTVTRRYAPDLQRQVQALLALLAGRRGQDDPIQKRQPQSGETVAATDRGTARENLIPQPEELGYG